jgi:hypothetical protein
MMISENWGDFLLPILRKVFDKHLEGMRDFIPVIYNVENSKKAQEFTHGVGSMGLMDDWEDTGNQVSYEEVYRGYKATYTHKKYSKGLRIERELLDDALYPEVKKRTKTLADSLYYTRQYHAARPFNECLTMVGADGKALAATDHPLGPFNSSTYTNYSTSYTLNATNVEVVRNAMKEWTDDKGNLIMVNPDTLIVPKALRKAALVIADSSGEPDTTDNNVNIWKGSVDVIEWDFLTNSNMWFMIDKNRMKRFLTWYQRRKGSLEADKQDFDTEVSKYKIIERFSYGWDDPTFLYACVQ